MAITLLHKQISKGPRNYRMQFTCAFSTTDANGTVRIPTELGGRCVICGLAIIGTPASDEVISFDEDAHTIQGIITITSGVLTIKRTAASKTSGLKFSFSIESPN